MRVLLLSTVAFDNIYISGLIRVLSAKGVIVDFLNLGAFKIFTANGKEIALYKRGYIERILRKFSLKLEYLYTLFKKRHLLVNLKGYDIINVHYVAIEYTKYALVLGKISKALILSFWGSDFLRISDKDKNTLKKILNLADLVSFNNENIKNIFTTYYQNKLYPTTILRFGIDNFDLIDKIRQTDFYNETIRKFNLEFGKINIACGYNATKGQQHLSILHELSYLPMEIKSEIHLLLQLTYPKDVKYIREIDIAADLLGISYTIFSNYLSSDDMARLRLVTDLSINIQITDSFSASIQEYCYCGAEIIVGDWLPYSTLEKIGCFIHKISSVKQLNERIGWIVNNIERSKNEINIINKKLYQYSSWFNNIDNWISTYNNIIIKR